MNASEKKKKTATIAHPKSCLILIWFSAASRKSLMPFTLPTLVNLSLALRNACLGIIHLAYPETRPVVMDEYFLAASSRQAPERIQMKKDFHRQCAAWLYCFKVTSQLVKQLYERDCRLSFCPEGHWLAASEIKASTDPGFFLGGVGLFASPPSK